MASDLPVLREVGGDAVLYFDPRSTRSIADALRVVATEPDRLERLSAAGLSQAAAFSWRRVAEETLEVFRAALADPR
jgi:glycosyltransferase involved in cell wall biosynthesis